MILNAKFEIIFQKTPYKKKCPVSRAPKPIKTNIPI